MLATKIQERESKILVVGLGYVGLPIAVEFCKRGFPVIGYDKDVTKVEGLRQGNSHVEDIADSGRTMAAVVARLETAGAASIKQCALLVREGAEKPDATIGT